MAFETLNSISGPVYYVRRFSKIVDIINVVAAWSILFLCNGAINKDWMKDLSVFWIRQNNTNKLSITSNRLRLPLTIGLL